MTVLETKQELQRLEHCRTASPRYLDAQLALERARVARLTERLIEERDEVFLVTTDPDDDETDEIRLGPVYALKTWRNAERLCPDLLEDLDRMRREWESDGIQAECDRAGWEADYASTRGA